MIKRDKKTGKQCVVLQIAGTPLFSDNRFVILGTEGKPPPLNRAKHYVVHVRKLADLEDIKR